MKRAIIALLVLTFIASGLISGVGCERGAAFVVTGLTFTPDNPKVGEEVTIQVDVENIGGAQGTYTVTLTVNGVEIDTQDITLAAGEMETVTFTHTWKTPGDYQIEVGGETATLTITGQGLLPVLHIGDQWVYHFTIGSQSYTETDTVTSGEVISGRDCYVGEVVSEPPMEGVASAMEWVDKQTLRPVKLEISGEHLEGPYTVTQTISYSPWPEGLWPLTVGTELTIIETDTIVITIGGETYPTTMSGTITIKVEAIEEITVPSGTFTCFKIVTYDENGEPILTQWYSDEVKNIVKTVDHETGDRYELLSYSLQ